MHVFSTARALRNYSKSARDESWVEKALTIAELKSRSLISRGHLFADDEIRILLLREATDVKNFHKLQIDVDFFSFIKNSEYLFNLFEELATEEVELKELKSADAYAEYEEHLKIIEEVLKNYKRLLKQSGYIDKITISKNSQLNSKYISSLGRIDLHLEGYLSRSEITLFSKIADIIPTFIHLHRNRFNKKMEERFREVGVSIGEHGKYIVNLSSRKVTDFYPQNTKIDATAVSLKERGLQVAWIKKSIYNLINIDGLKPEEIVVILPDEQFESMIRLYDNEGNLNFSMGETFTKTLFYRRVSAVYEYCEEQNKQSYLRVKRYGLDVEIDRISLLSRWRIKIDKSEFSKLVMHLGVSDEKESSLQRVKKELHLLESLPDDFSELTISEKMRILLNRLSLIRDDDVKGGKITVMGLLESRGVAFKGVVVVDFNDDIVPKKSNKDLYLNSSVREHARLPTIRDREDLQKYYYLRLFESAQKVLISFVSNETQIPSRFLLEMGISHKEYEAQSELYALLFPKHVKRKVPSEPIIDKYNFKSRPISATGLNIFLSCRRKFYYRYVKRVATHEVPSDIPKEHEIGNWLHGALKSVYEKRAFYNNVDSLREAIKTALQKFNSGVLQAYLIELWMKKLEPFIENEIERFNQKTRVESCEKRIGMIHEGIPIQGVVDRIDRVNNRVEVLDYKSGNYKIYSARSVDKATDFQLEFYYLLASEIGEVSNIGFYDLSSGKIIEEAFLERKLEILKEHFFDLKQTDRFDFFQTQDHSLCRICEYATLCEREL